MPSNQKEQQTVTNNIHSHSLQAFWRPPRSLGDLYRLAEETWHSLLHHAWHRPETCPQVKTFVGISYHYT